MPICRPTFAVWRKLVAGALVFTVVVVWHDTNRAVLTWIAINAAVLLTKGAAGWVQSLASSFRRCEVNRCIII